VPFRGCRRPRDKPARHRGRPESHLAAGDIGEDSVAEGVAAAIDTFGSIDILVNNATFQRTSEIFDEIPNDEFE
jgi:NAD(P)-dependent dehydrogenase (short-subunit alcohol dehydrogenase family)